MMGHASGSEVRRIRTEAGLGVVLERFGSPSERPRVLLLHGGGQTRHSWSEAARQVAASGHEAWTMDLRGHGGSEWASDVRARMSDMLSPQGVATFREPRSHADVVDIADAGHVGVGDRNGAFTTAAVELVDQLGERDEELAR